MSDALGTAGGVVSAVEHRLALAGAVTPQSSTLAVRTGVMWGPGTTTLVTGTSTTGTMTVNVAAHHWVTTRGAGDGVYLGAKEASGTVNIAAAPGSNSRIDVVYSKMNDAGSSVSPDGSTGELYGVVTGTAAVSPTKPALPVGAVEIATVTVAAGATNTLGAGVTIANTAAQTVARGARIPVRSQTERDALTLYSGLEVYRLDTGQVQLYTGSAWVSPYPAADTGWQNLTINSPASNLGTSRYRVLNGICYFNLATTTPSGNSSNFVLTTMPVGARPPTDYWFVGVYTGVTSTQVTISASTGTMVLLAAGAAGSFIVSGSYPVT